MNPFTITLGNIEYLPNKINTDPAQINPNQPPPAFFNDEPNADGITINVVGPAMSAGCSTRVLTLPPNVSNFQFSFDTRPSPNADQYGYADEDDIIITDFDDTWYNASCDFNRALGGEWRIGGWTRTGLKGSIPPDVWTTVIHRFHMDRVNKNLVWDSINGQMVPASVATIPGKPGASVGWGKGGIIGIQHQRTRNALAGEFEYSTDLRNVTLQCW